MASALRLGASCDGGTWALGVTVRGFQQLDGLGLWMLLLVAFVDGVLGASGVAARGFRQRRLGASGLLGAFVNVGLGASGVACCWGLSTMVVCVRGIWQRLIGVFGRCDGVTLAMVACGLSLLRLKALCDAWGVLVLRLLDFGDGGLWALRVAAQGFAR